VKQREGEGGAVWAGAFGLKPLACEMGSWAAPAGWTSRPAGRKREGDREEGKLLFFFFYSEFSNIFSKKTF
jgi:hypothetical protein